jgi:Fe-S-cluster containining protein
MKTDRRLHHSLTSLWKRPVGVKDRKGDCPGITGEAVDSGLSPDDKGFRCIEGCVRCCTDKGNPLELTLGDIIRLCRHLSMRGGDFFKDYCEVIWNRIPGTCLLIPSVGLIFPCRFLKEGKCIVYDIRPIHCRLFPEALIVDNGNLDIYRNCGYRCIDSGIELDRFRKAYIHRLKDIDRQELKAMASYFENFKYCVELKVKEFERISNLLSGVDRMERDAKKREVFTEAIDKGDKERVETIFIKKMGKLRTRFSEWNDGLSAFSKAFSFI